MKHCAHASRFAALLLSLLIASRAQADWLNSFVYCASVSNSAGGPFAPTANLWSQGASSIDLIVFADPHVSVFDGNAHLPFAMLDISVGRGVNPPPAISHATYFIQLTLPNMPNVVLSGDISSENLFGPINFTSGSPAALTVAGKQFAITIQELPMPIPLGMSPDAPNFTVGEYELFATIPLNELAEAPEPSALLLAGIGGASLVGAAWRRRRARSSRA